MAPEASPSVPPPYRGVWVRRLLESPQGRDETSCVHWLQASVCHADLRIPAGDLRSAAAQQGFAGRTRVTRDEQGEICHWLREVDLQPPPLTPDAGRMVFERDDRVVETGLHSDYLEVWERLPASTGRFAVLERADGESFVRWLVAGCYAMRVRPRRCGWPADTQSGDSLAAVLHRHPGQAEALLDFEISFGRLQEGRWTIDHSSLRPLEGSTQTIRFERISERQCLGDGTRWQILEWDGSSLMID